MRAGAHAVLAPVIVRRRCVLPVVTGIVRRPSSVPGSITNSGSGIVIVGRADVDLEALVGGRRLDAVLVAAPLRAQTALVHREPGRSASVRRHRDGCIDGRCCRASSEPAASRRCRRCPRAARAWSPHRRRCRSCSGCSCDSWCSMPAPRCRVDRRLALPVPGCGCICEFVSPPLLHACSNIAAITTCLLSSSRRTSEYPIPAVSLGSRTYIGQQSRFEFYARIKFELSTSLRMCICSALRCYLPAPAAVSRQYASKRPCITARTRLTKSARSRRLVPAVSIGASQYTITL